MRGKAALIGFLVLWAAMTVFWVASLLPLTSPNAPPFISEGPQIWSGGGYTSYSDDFRQRTTSIAAGSFEVFGNLLYATLLLIASGATAIASRIFFKRGKGMIAAGALVATLALGAAGAWFIVLQWEGGTLFPAHSVNTGWLYTVTRTLLIDLGVGYVLLLAGLGLVIADVATKDKPLGFGFVILNWLVVVLLWIAIYVGLFILPTMGAPPSAA